MFDIDFVKFEAACVKVGIEFQGRKCYPLRQEGVLMQVAICDDEKSLRTGLRRVIETKLQLEGVTYEIAEYDSGEALLNGILQAVPDLLFLDIEMKGLNGMDTARKLRESCKTTMIIFVTAYPDFVFQGYEVKAFHYLLKPYKESKIYEVIEHALDEMEAEREQFYLIEKKSGSIRLPLKEVYYFKSEGRSIEAVKKDETLRFYGKLGEIEEEMPSSYRRVHNRYLVNLKYVSKIESDSILCGGMEIPVSRAYRQELMVAFARMMLK